jgi:hypothetical protein
MVPLSTVFAAVTLITVVNPVVPAGTQAAADAGGAPLAAPRTSTPGTVHATRKNGTTCRTDRRYLNFNPPPLTSMALASMEFSPQHHY